MPFLYIKNGVFLGHRKSSKDIPSMAQQIVHKKHKHHHKHHKRSSYKESQLARSDKQPEDTVSNDVSDAKDKVDIGRRPKAHTISSLMPVGLLPSVSETTEAGYDFLCNRSISIIIPVFCILQIVAPKLYFNYFILTGEQGSKIYLCGKYI